MGVKLFTKEMLNYLSNVDSDAKERISAIFIDGNQFLYAVVEYMKKIIGTHDMTDQNLYRYAGTEKEFKKILNDKIIEVIDEKIINELKEYKKLKQIIFCLDGVPVVGKMVNQFSRRKMPTKTRFYIGNDIVFSDALIMANSEFMIMFRNIVKEKLLKFKKDNVSIILSLDDIPGEGEHKILDFLRYNDFVSSISERVLIWSDDSDVPICLLSSDLNNIYIKTKVHSYVAGNHVIKDKHYDLAELKRKVANDVREKDNSQLLLAFAGNDYLPEILNFNTIDTCYERLRKICSVKLINTDRTLNYENLEIFIKAFSNEEMDFYFQEKKNHIETKRYRQFSEYNYDLTKANSDKVEFKRFYYTNILSHYVKVDDVTDSDIFHFEIGMTVSYLKTYIWYYYYQNGYFIPGHEDQFYSFHFPPLINSLLYVLRNTEQYSDLHSMINTKPQIRELTYFQNLFNYGEIHHAIVLQKEEAKLIKDKKIIIARNKVLEKYEDIYSSRLNESFFIKTRLYTPDSKMPVPIFVYPLIDPKKILNLLLKELDIKLTKCTNKYEVHGDEYMSVKNTLIIRQYAFNIDGDIKM